MENYTEEEIGSNMVASFNVGVHEPNGINVESVQKAFMDKQIPSTPIEALAFLTKFEFQVWRALGATGYDVYLNMDEVQRNWCKVFDPKVMKDVVIDPTLSLMEGNIRKERAFKHYRSDDEKAVLELNISIYEDIMANRGLTQLRPESMRQDSQIDYKEVKNQLNYAKIEKIRAEEFEEERKLARIWLKNCTIANGKALNLLQEILTPDLQQRLNVESAGAMKMVSKEQERMKALRLNQGLFEWTDGDDTVTVQEISSYVRFSTTFQKLIDIKAKVTEAELGNYRASLYNPEFAMKEDERLGDYYSKFQIRLMVLNHKESDLTEKEKIYLFCKHTQAVQRFYFIVERYLHPDKMKEIMDKRFTISTIIDDWKHSDDVHWMNKMSEQKFAQNVLVRKDGIEKRLEKPGHNDKYKGRKVPHYMKHKGMKERGGQIKQSAKMEVMSKNTKEDLIKRMRCHRCGKIGHLRNSCRVDLNKLERQINMIWNDHDNGDGGEIQSDSQSSNQEEDYLILNTNTKDDDQLDDEGSDGMIHMIKVVDENEFIHKVIDSDIIGDMPYELMRPLLLDELFEDDKLEIVDHMHLLKKLLNLHMMKLKQMDICIDKEEILHQAENCHGISCTLIYLEELDIFKDELNNVWNIDHKRRIWRNDRLIIGEESDDEIESVSDSSGLIRSDDDSEDYRRTIDDTREYRIYESDEGSEIVNKNKNAQYYFNSINMIRINEFPVKYKPVVNARRMDDFRVRQAAIRYIGDRYKFGYEPKYINATRLIVFIKLIQEKRISRDYQKKIYAYTQVTYNENDGLFIFPEVPHGFYDIGTPKKTVQELGITPWWEDDFIEYIESRILPGDSIMDDWWEERKLKHDEEARITLAIMNERDYEEEQMNNLETINPLPDEEVDDQEILESHVRGMVYDIRVDNDEEWIRKANQYIIDNEAQLKRKRNKRELPNEESSDKSESDINMILMHHFNSVSNDKPKQDVLIDSGAQVSVLQIKPDNMINFKRRDNQLLTFANGSNLEIEGNGRLGGFNNIAICRSMSENIAAVSQLTDRGCSVIFDKDKVIIMKPKIEMKIKNEEIMIMGNRSNNLYKVGLDNFVDGVSQLP